MGFFDKFTGKKNKNPKERNEIDNKQLKETLANAALATLKEGEDYDSLAHTTVNFGYLFEIDDHGLEALFKVTTDKATFYFAAQKQSIMRLNFNEGLFETTTQGFLDLHS